MRNTDQTHTDKTWRPRDELGASRVQRGRDAPASRRHAAVQTGRVLSFTYSRAVWGSSFWMRV